MPQIKRTGNVHAKANKLDHVYQDFAVRETEERIEYYHRDLNDWCAIPEEWKDLIVWNSTNHHDSLTRFITVSRFADYWGDTDSAPDFDSEQEARKIQEAADSCGITVYMDEDPPHHFEDYNMIQIEWFETWCRDGYLWSVEQWQDFFQKQTGKDS